MSIPFYPGFLLQKDNFTRQIVKFLFASLVKFERAIIGERTKAGLTAARIRARHGERPKGLTKEALSKAQAAKMLYLQRDKAEAEIG